MKHSHINSYLLMGTMVILMTACSKNDPKPPNACASPKDMIALAKTLDADNDGINNWDDNCKSTYNPKQKDKDEDGIGDVCDKCPSTPAMGTDRGCPEV